MCYWVIVAHEKRGSEYGVLHFFTEESGTLADIIRTHTHRSHEEIVSLSELGCVYLNEKRVVALSSEILPRGQYLRVHTNPRRFQIDEDTVQILFQDDEFLVANKPSGIPVHSTVDNIRDNLIEILQRRLGLKLFVTHRLDIATSGLIVLAKTPEFQAAFNSLLRSGKVEKKYRALVSASDSAASPLERGQKLVHYMEPSPRAPKTVSNVEHTGWQRCSMRILESRKLEEGFTELLIELETGRTHQIRAQLAFEKWPIVGDVAYGSPIDKSNPNEIALQSCAIQFETHKFKLS